MKVLVQILFIGFKGYGFGKNDSSGVTVPSKVSATKGTRLLITRFYPHTTSLFFPNRMSEFRNNSYNIQDILGYNSAWIRDAIMQSETIQDKVTIIECFLVRQVKACRRDYNQFSLIDSIFKRINNNNELSRLKDLIPDHSLSHRYIQKMFREFVGLTPKLFLRIERLKSSLQLLHNRKNSLTQMALICGYYDQSHFIREFKEFTGMTPSQFLSRNKPVII